MVPQLEQLHFGNRIIRHTGLEKKLKKRRVHCTRRFSIDVLVPVKSLCQASLDGLVKKGHDVTKGGIVYIHFQITNGSYGQNLR